MSRAGCCCHSSVRCQPGGHVHSHWKLPFEACFAVHTRVRLCWRCDCCGRRCFRRQGVCARLPTSDFFPVTRAHCDGQEGDRVFTSASLTGSYATAGIFSRKGVHKLPSSFSYLEARSFPLFPWYTSLSSSCVWRNVCWPSGRRDWGGTFHGIPCTDSERMCASGPVGVDPWSLWRCWHSCCGVRKVAGLQHHRHRWWAFGLQVQLFGVLHHEGSTPRLVIQGTTRGLTSCAQWVSPV
jgi:hypothetical protein